MAQKHNVDPSRTGNEICQKVIEEHLKSCGLSDAGNHAAQIMGNIIGNQFPLAVVQQGQLSDMLDAAEANIKENDRIRSMIDSLRKQIGTSIS